MSKVRLPEIAAAAVQCERETSVPAELLAAQCILESGWGELESGKFNVFGIKARNGEPGTLCTTHEWFTNAEYSAFLAKGDGRTAELVLPVKIRGPRREYLCKDYFADFPSLAVCFARRAALFAAGPYRTAAATYREDSDLSAYIRAIGPVYATAPTYADDVLKIIRQADVLAAISEARKAHA